MYSSQHLKCSGQQTCTINVTKIKNKSWTYVWKKHMLKIFSKYVEDLITTNVQHMFWAVILLKKKIPNISSTHIFNICSLYCGAFMFRIYSTYRISGNFAIIKFSPLLLHYNIFNTQKLYLALFVVRHFLNPNKRK